MYGIFLTGSWPISSQHSMETITWHGRIKYSKKMTENSKGCFYFFLQHITKPGDENYSKENRVSKFRGYTWRDFGDSLVRVVAWTFFFFFFFTPWVSRKPRDGDSSANIAKHVANFGRQNGNFGRRGSIKMLLGYSIQKVIRWCPASLDSRLLRR